MAKRRLSKQQNQRIAQQHKRRADRARDAQPATDDSVLGPEQEGRVITQFGKQVEVESCDAPHSVHRCFLRANLGAIVTGDRVIWCDSEQGAVVVSVLPRRTELVRPDTFGKLRPVAANVDRMLITVAPQPEPHPNLVDRYLVVAENLGLRAVIVVNKADLPDSVASTGLEYILRVYPQLGYPVLQVSAHTGDGMATLQECVSEGTSIFVGQSGAGKSSLIQTLLPDESIKIGELSEQVAKGRHTTTHSRLYHFPGGGSCIDSPGIREFGLWHMSADEVAGGFREFHPLLGLCRFRDCSHDRDPNCALRGGVEDGSVLPERFESFRRIVNSLDAVSVREE